MSLRPRAHTVLFAALATFALVGMLPAQSLSPEKETALEAVDQLASEIHLMAMTLWDYS